ncbi:hypothetical protein DFH27DRAFT_60161 [Peziza echinospora]|nr:hypothetical protein DFH27DRAFT_60161 [Peziza echinospora]
MSAPAVDRVVDTNGIGHGSIGTHAGHSLKGGISGVGLGGGGGPGGPNGPPTGGMNGGKLNVGTNMNGTTADHHNHSLSGGSPAAAGTPAAVSPAVDNSEATNARVEGILLSDIGLSTLLTRLKQSIASCREFAGFLKKRANIEEEHAQGLRKLTKLTYESPKRLDCRHGSFLRQFDETTSIHDRIAENGLRFSLELHQMYEDLMELANNMERGRRHWKMAGTVSEKKAHEDMVGLEKAKAKYDQIAEEYERARGGDKRARDFKPGRGFARTNAQLEEDLQKRVLQADQEYAQRVQVVNAHRGELLSVQRPQAVKALKDLVFECDSSLTFQLQKFATLNEKLLLSNGLSINPIKGNNPSGPHSQSMREVIALIDNETDFKKFVLSMESKLPQSAPAEIKYEKHPSLNPNNQSPYGPPGTAGGYGSQTGLPGLQRESSNQSQNQNHSQGYGAVITQPAIIPIQQPGYNLSQQQYSQPPPTAPTFQELPRDRPVFGVPLDVLLERDGSAVPIIVYQCIQAIDMYGLELEGIYRIPGTKQHIEMLKNRFDHDSTKLDFRRREDFFKDVNSVTSVLKTYFRELPDTLLTTALYPEFIQAAKIEDDLLRRDTLHGIINRLPDPNYATFRALTLHLSRVKEKAAINRMNSQNIAICFGPTLMANHDLANTGWQVRVVDTVLQNWISIFDPDE